MNFATIKSLTRRPPVIVATLAIVTVLAFLGVNRLVTRFREQEKALARHLYERGLQEQNAGRPERAVEYYRAALSYARGSFDYQLSLARALRDTGRTAESETYLITLWEHSPQEGAVNLALGRLFAREQLVDKAVQYYHNAIYGLWPADAERKRREIEFELISYLLQHQAYPQAQAELINMAASMPVDPELRLRVAGLFAEAKDDEHALLQFQNILQSDPDNQRALIGAGQAALRLGRYRTARDYLQRGAHADPKNAAVSQLLNIAILVLQSNPYAARISDKERSQRVRSAFQAAGERLEDCARTKGIDMNSPLAAAGLPALKSRWLETAPKLKQSGQSRAGSSLDADMDLVFEIEQQTQELCGSSGDQDRALLLISQDRSGVER